ncbi:hypothetical protein P4S91_14450, partial [Aneurinibacillus aneurinilyticus]|uniref:hypothetical protein n=1 Tax=Aneurinibacillus aneurinilyticus TaxID=1391 RepID=UPI002E236D0A|nr:hypothetical protein [Aneurinibacillus aneurinilyticus]
ISRLLIIHKVEKRRCTRRRVPSSFSHKEGTQTRPFVSLPKRLPRPGEKGQQLSPSSRLPRCFAVPTG